MTELQTKEFEILKEVLGICEKLDIRCFLVCGTALGAVKYKGFIPWDDDIDISMYREDYEIFCEKAPEMLSEKYFLQTYKTDCNFPYIFAKVRDSETTYIEKSNSEINMHHGIYIDVFPLDGYPQDKKSAAALERKKNILNLQRACVFKTNENYSLKSRAFLKLERILGWHRRVHSIVGKIEKLISQWSVKDSEVICNHGNWQGKLEYAPKAQYGEGAVAEFEGIEVRVPEKYDEYLTQKYGDWRADLPEEEKVGHHFYQVCDTEKPYTSYVEILSDRKIKVK